MIDFLLNNKRASAVVITYEEKIAAVVVAGVSFLFLFS